MTSRLLILSIAVLALLMVPAAYNPADAHRAHGSHGSFRYSGGGGSYGHRHHHHRFIFLGAPYYYYGDNYYYGDGCYWLRRRALNTGSRYWWNRYYRCVGY